MIPTTNHNEALAGDTLYSAFLNHEWRTIVMPFVIRGMAEIAAAIEDESERQDFEVRYGAMIDDFYNFELLSEQYRQRVMATAPLRFNRLNESIGSQMFDISGANYDGTYSGVTWGTGESQLGEAVPKFDGVNDAGNLYSAAFATAVNMDEFTLMVWFKVNALSVWTDGVTRYFVVLLRNSQNSFAIGKWNVNNLLYFSRTGSGVNKAHWEVSSDTGWVCAALSCSIAGGGLLNAGDFRAYKNGVNIRTLTGNIASAGAGLNPSYAVIGAADFGTKPNPHNGWLSNVMMWNRPIDNDILDLMKIY